MCTFYSRLPIQQENQASHTVQAGLRPAKSSKGQGSKTKRYRTAFTELQLSVLKAEFAENISLHSVRRKKISASMGLLERVLKVWFQNRRQEMKKDKRRVLAGVSNNSATKSACESTNTPVYTIHLHWSQQPEIHQHVGHIGQFSQESHCGRQQITQHVYIQQDDGFQKQQLHGTPHHFSQNQQQYVGRVGQQLNYHPSVSQQKDCQQDAVQQLVNDICRVLPHEFWQEVMAYAGSCSNPDIGSSSSPEVADMPAIFAKGREEGSSSSREI